MFGDTPHYLVSDKQKPELIELLTPEPPALILLGLGLGWDILTWIFAVIAMASSLGFKVESASLLELVEMVLLCVAPLLALFPAVAAVQLQQLKPTLRELPQTDQRITWREMRDTKVSNMSLTRVLFVGGLWIFLALMQGINLAIRTAHHPLFSDPQSII